MKPAPFDFVAATSLEDVTSCLRSEGESAKVIAGGQSLMAMLNMRLIRPEVLIDPSRIECLRAIRVVDNVLEVGANVTQSELLDWPQLASVQPLLAKALPYVGHFQTRNRGTVCGSICHSDPSSELPLVLATLGGEVVLKSHRRTRVLMAKDFQAGMLTTACKPEEFVTAVRFPVARANEGFAFAEVARRHGDFAIVALAAVSDGRTVRLGVGGVADKPDACTLTDITDQTRLDDQLNAVAWELRGSDDIHASARYRREIVRALGRKVVSEAHNAAP